MPALPSPSPQSGVIDVDIEMEDHGSSALMRHTSRQTLLDRHDNPKSRGGGGRLAGVARHTMGLILLLCVVFLWTTGNFLGSVRDFPFLSSPSFLHRRGWERDQKESKADLKGRNAEHIRRRHVRQTVFPHLSQHLDLHAGHDSEPHP